MANLMVEERLKESLEVCELQRNKLKLCRLTMREYGIGHLYPGATKEYEEDMQKSMALMSAGDSQGTQQLYKAAKLHQFQFESANKKLKKLLNFIESKGISAQELQNYMVENTKILADDEEENNLQTQSLEDASKERR